jgi:hypothetical protein
MQSEFYDVHAYDARQVGHKYARCGLLEDATLAAMTAIRYGYKGEEVIEVRIIKRPGGYEH